MISDVVFDGKRMHAQTDVVVDDATRILTKSAAITVEQAGGSTLRDV
ncbi:hypothetical protein [Cryobacterium sp. Y29]|nr:hypothetical protein [Cryobacterium sp. Y29]